MDSINVNINTAQKTIQKKSTCNAICRAVKCFGRNVCKIVAAIPYVAYHIFSLSTEAVFGAAGAVVGALRGGTVKLVRAVGAKFALCRKSTRPLSDYIIKDFHMGANIGWLSGQVVGVAGAFVTTAGLLNPFSLIVGGTLISSFSLKEAVDTFLQIKKQGYSSAEQNSMNLLDSIRHDCRSMHDQLYGGISVTR